MSEALFRYRSPCGLLVIEEQPGQRFSIKQDAYYDGPAPDVFINDVLESRMERLVEAERAQATTQEHRRMDLAIGQLTGELSKPRPA